MLYIIVDNYAGGVVCFDNETDFKRFIKDWKHNEIENDGSIDYEGFTAYYYSNAKINISYNDYMESTGDNQISLR